MRISDWSSDVCSSDLYEVQGQARPFLDIGLQVWPTAGYPIAGISQHQRLLRQAICILQSNLEIENMVRLSRQRRAIHEIVARGRQRPRTVGVRNGRSEEHTSELQSLMRISYAVFCLKKKN